MYAGYVLRLCDFCIILVCLLVQLLGYGHSLVVLCKWECKCRGLVH